MASLDSMPSQDCIQHNVHRQLLGCRTRASRGFPGCVPRYPWPQTLARFRRAHKVSSESDWYDDGLDSCRIVEGEVVWRATALEGLRSFRLSVLTACARR